MPSSYFQLHEFTLKAGGKELRVISKPGFATWERMPVAVSLLSEAVEVQPAVDVKPGSRVLIFSGGPWAAALVAGLYPEGSWLVLTDNNWIALNMARRTLEMNQMSCAQISQEIELASSDYATFDSAWMVLPKGRGLARRWLLQAWLALKEGGELYLAGARDSGVKSAINDAADLFCGSAVLLYKKGNRVARLVRKAASPTLPDWANEPGIAPGSWIEFTVQARDTKLTLRSLPGVFSADRLDEGTGLLLENLPHTISGRILDMGCGSGVIGLCAALSGASTVDMVDADLLAVASAQENIRRNHIPNASASAMDIGPQNEHYNLILSNPPFHAGKQVDFRIAEAFVEYAEKALLPGGRLRIVANRFIPYDDLIQRVFGEVRLVAKTNQFWVLEGIK